ncbi:ABC transporter permease [Paenibacillus sp. FSL A5-0031]|uniref:carbohydrate ABC transporter permease n=1 Tax=Paenibacillus sp. FSL A5-0031 TaxID=1920420 RepID=UPI00096C0950|nr:sugar ABC transporter permease [Paenibacillus sp. FSL A5-0031]OME81509.1 ABC transporter permease [Paenibacillus sp. FSL A5-0031]
MKSYVNLTGYLFISPFLIGFFLLTLYPALQSLYFSFTDYSLLEPGSWVGTDNYKRMFTADPNFSKSLGITFTYVIFAVPLKLLFALLVAIVLNKQIKGMSFYRTIMYLPSLIGGSIAVAVLWKNIFGAEGFISKLLSWFGIENMSMVTNPDTALSTLVLLQAWQFGSAMIIFLAGLKQIPKELYEASSVDGAGKLRQFFSVTLTMLSPVILFNLILGLIGSFQMFTQAFIITKGGPLKSTYMYALYLYEKAFGAFQMGYASALAWVLLLIIAAATALNFAISKYWVFYESEGGR